MKKKKILIVGGAGYIGGHLTDVLWDNGRSNYDITVLDKLMFESRYLKPVKFLRRDIVDYDSMIPILNDYDIIVWLAAYVGDGACAVNPRMSKIVNEEAVQMLVKNFRGHIIYMSTCSVYGVNRNLIDENSTTNPLSVYAETKLAAEQYIVKNVPENRYTIFRLGTLFGTGDIHSRIRLDLVANLLAFNAATGKPLTVNGGEQWRPLLHVKDVGDAIKYAIDNDIGGLYNLSNRNYNIKDIAEEIKRIKPDTTVNYVTMKFEDLRDYRVLNDKILKTGWKPQRELWLGIQEIIDLFEQERIVNPEDPVYNNHVYMKKSYDYR